MSSNLLDLVFNGRFKVSKGGYKTDKLIFNGLFLLIIGYLLFVGWSYNWSLDYYYCETSNIKGCLNPFYEPVTWKNAEYLEPGVLYGTKPGLLFNSVKFVVPFMSFIALYLNHKLHNKGKKIEWKKYIDRLGEE